MSTEALAKLAAINADLGTRYPGDSVARQPIHTVYGGAQLFDAWSRRCDLRSHPRRREPSSWEIQRRITSEGAPRLTL